MAARPRIFVTTPAGVVFDTFFPAEIRARLEELGKVQWNETGDNLSPSDLARRLPGVDTCFTGWDAPRFDAEVLRGADRLRLLAHTCGSVAKLVSPELYDRGVTVVSGNRVFAESVAESVIAYALLALRRLTDWTREVQEGRWMPIEHHTEGLLDQSVGLVGFGAVARCLVPLLRAFRARIRVYDPFVSPAVFAEHGVEAAGLEEVVTRSKIVSLHAPRTPQTANLIDAKLLRRIPDGTLFINTARGSIVDEAALAAELATGRFMAVLDVFQVEPLPADSPLRGLPNAILVPHMAGPTVDRRRLATLAVLEDAERLLEGKPLQHAIDRAYAMGMTQ